MFLHLYLIDSHQVEFDRVFSRHDVGIDRVERLQGRIKSVGLTTTRWTSNQNHAVRFGDVALELDQRFGFETQFGHVEHQVLFIEKTEHDFFSEQGWQRRNAEIQFARACINLHLDLDAAVLRKTLLRNVQLGHNFDARN